MKVLDHFSIPYQGLKNGLHKFKFEIDDDFFAQFENSIVNSGKFDVNLLLDKRTDLSVAEFTFEGEVEVCCARCLADFKMPLEGDYRLHIKFGESNLDDEDVMFVDQEVSSINFAQYIYESICISLPMVISHDDIDDCDPEVISRMEGQRDEEDEVSSNPWAGLKGLNIDDNKN